MILDRYLGKTVLITGHTGFKGSWLTTWLQLRGAKVIGVSKNIPTNPSIYEVINIEPKIKSYQTDLRDLPGVKRIVEAEEPDFVFHLAAQSIVSRSYEDPIETVTTNVIGTMHVLEALRKLEKPCAVVLITSDKVYDNVEWVWGYRETDRLGGKDVYSGSKGATELIIRSYFYSFLRQESNTVRIGVARAGNVIGGGDWSPDRVVADCMRAWSNGDRVSLRSPQTTRPWQYVLEPLFGYLTLGIALTENDTLHGEAFNFGPRWDENQTVLKLIRDLASYWGFESPDDAYKIMEGSSFNEARLLKLNCDKAQQDLHWAPTLSFEETIRFTGEWYKAHYMEEQEMLSVTEQQIRRYEQLSFQRVARTDRNAEP